MIFSVILDSHDMDLEITPLFSNCRFIFIKFNIKNVNLVPLIFEPNDQLVKTS
jgi:hypothetical protein